jgi:hypothetical protein
LVSSLATVSILLYHIQLTDLAVVSPGGASLVAAGSWCPGRNELATIRSNIENNPRRLRRVIAAPDFVKFFGEPKRDPKGKRQNIFGAEDELKVAPKGVDKGHKLGFHTSEIGHKLNTP